MMYGKGNAQWSILSSTNEGNYKMKFNIAYIKMEPLQKSRENCGVHLHRTLEILGTLTLGGGDDAQVIMSSQAPLTFFRLVSALMELLI